MIDKASIISPSTGQFELTADYKYKGYHAAQNTFVFEMLDKLDQLTSSNVDVIIEIGTFYGGLTKTLQDHHISNNATIYTYDIHDSLVSEEGGNINFIRKDIFEDVDTIKNNIRNKKTVILCDGGDKIKELQVFAPLLSKGDFILCHDFAENAHLYANGIRDVYWCACEVTMDERVVEAININNLIKHNHDCFTKSVWLCLEKS